MRIVNRVLTSCVLVLPACSDGAAAESAGPSTGAVDDGLVDDGEASTAVAEESTGEDGTSNAGNPPASSEDGGDGSSTGDPPPVDMGWCVFEVIADAEHTGLDVLAAPEPSAAVLRTLAIGETVWGSSTVVDGYRDLDRSLANPQWAESARLSNTGECDDAAPPEELPLPEAFQLPFTCGDAWRLDSWGHAPALDMVREPDQVGTEGAPLVAPADGVVNMSFFHDNAGNVVQIDHGEGYFTTFLHMDSRAVEVGDVLAGGDVIGAVGRTGPTANNHPHLHFELGIDADGDGEASWGFEGAERVRPWFGGIEYGQENALTWRDVVSMNCP